MNLVAAIALAISMPLGTPARVVSVGSTHARVVALTFDAGADRGHAAAILTTLEKNRTHASFGMTGRWAQQNPDLVRRIARDRDTFINHTFDHRSFTGLSSQAAPLSASQRVWEVTQAEKVIKRLTGMSTKPYFRPPYGDYDPAMLTLLPRLGYRFSVMWTVDSGGWLRIPAHDIVQRSLTGVRPGAIILMHVGSQSADATALQPLITELRHRGYRFVTVPKLLRMS